jgi:putative peptidoglycan lipid II flippase
MEKKSMARAAGSVSLAVMISRILGVVREQVLAAYFSAFHTDAFFIAFRIPNLLRDLFAEGALTAAFVPTFTDYLNNRGKKEAWRLANIVINAMVIVLSLITLVICLGAKYLVLLLAHGFQAVPGKLELATKLAQIMSPFLLFVALAAAFMGLLNTQGKFFIPALAPAMFNVTNILAGVLLSPLMPKIGQEPIVSMAIGSLAGAMGQLFIQLPSAYRSGYQYERVLDLHHPGLRRIGVLMLPAIFGLAATQINILIDNQFASQFGNGPISWLNYAFRLMQLPIGIFGVAIATANLAAVSRDAAQGDYAELKRTLARSVRMAALLTIPATAGLIALRYPIIQVLYQHGRFTHQATLETSQALLYYTLGLFAYSVVKIVAPTFYALGDSKTPVMVSAGAIGIKIMLNFILVPYMGFLGLALSTSAAAMINIWFLYRALKSKIGGLAHLDVFSTIAKVTLSSIGMAVMCFYAYSAAAHVLPPTSFFKNVIDLSLAIGLGIVSVFSFCALLKVKEVYDLRALVLRKMKRGATP